MLDYVCLTTVQHGSAFSCVCIIVECSPDHYEQ